MGKWSRESLYLGNSVMAVCKSHLFSAMADATCATLAFLEACVHASDHVPQLHLGDLAGRYVAVYPLPFPIYRACSAHLRDLRGAAQDGPLFYLRGDPEITRTMRVTARRIEFFRFLERGRWFATSQVHRRFFASKTFDATRRWLRAGVESNYLIATRENRMSEKFFTLGPEGKRVLERSGSREIRVERRLPKQIEHFRGINDLRIAAELTSSLSFFFSSWELLALKWKHPIIPDAVFELGGKTFAAEFDRGLEAVKFFLQTKVLFYERGFEGLPLSALIIITDRWTRLEALMKAVVGRRFTVLLTTIELVRQHDLTSPIFYRYGDDHRVSLP
jgi:hypothetical protein